MKDLYEKALAREKAARKEAEKLLEDKTRELYLLNQDVQTQNANLEQKNEALALFNHLLTYSEQKIANPIDIVKNYMATLCHFAQWPFAVLQIVSQQDMKVGNLAPLVFTGDTQEGHLNAFSPFENTPEVFEQWIKQNQPAFLEYETPFASKSFKALCEKHDIKSFHVAPISRHDKIYAMVIFFSSEALQTALPQFHFSANVTQQLTLVLDRLFTNLELVHNNQVLTQTLAELRATEAKLIQSSKMASIGQLAAGIAHEINTPMGYTMNNLSVMGRYLEQLKKIADGFEVVLQNPQENKPLTKELIGYFTQGTVSAIFKESDEILSECEEGLTTITEIVKGLKNFSRVDQAQNQSIDLNICVESTLKVMEHNLKHIPNVKVDLQPLPDVECQPGKINQVIMNLVTNALYAMRDLPGEPALTISTQAYDNEVHVIIQDNGSGIEQDSLTQIFDPFYTTKPVGEGTGLGLSISYGIIEEHQGSIQVDTELGQGTTFKVILPVKQPLAIPEQSA